MYTRSSPKIRSFWNIENKRWANENEKKPGVMILTSNEVEFRPRKIKSQRKALLMLNCVIRHKNVTTMNINSPQDSKTTKSLGYIGAKERERDY